MSQMPLPAAAQIWPTPTRLSPFNGPQHSNLTWKYNVSSRVKASPAIGPDGTVYGGTTDGKLYAIGD